MLVIFAVVLVVASLLALPACTLDCEVFGHDWGEPTVDSAATCAEDGKYVLTCRRCGEVKDGETITASGVHNFDELHNRVEPKCNEAGSVAYKQCLDCRKLFTDAGELIGDSADDVIIPATGEHSWEEGEVTKAATCLEMGTQTYECSVCHEQKTVELGIADHIYGDLHKEIEPTCVDDGHVAYYQCSTCLQYFDEEHEPIGDSADDVIINATGEHSWEAGEITKVATCLETGAQIYKCSVCKKQETRVIDLANHKYGDLHHEITATCLVEGRLAYYQCSVCEQYFGENFVFIGDSEEDLVISTAGKHSWKAGDVTVPATCTEKGSQTYTCSVCNEQESRELEMIAHAFGDFHNEVPPTCIDKGVKAYRQCLSCEQYFTELGEIIGSASDLEIPATDDHSFVAGEVTEQPTCFKTGKQTFECSVCRKQESRELGIVDHKYGDLHQEIAPTCVNEGLKAYKQCEYCEKYFTQQGEIIGASEEDLAISPTGVHDFRAGEVTKRPTCLEVGAQAYECSMCHEQKNVKLDIIDHNYGDLHIAVEPTCGSDGNVAYYQCSMCSKYFDSDRAPLESIVRNATGEHSWGIVENDGWIWAETYEELLEFGVQANIICSVCNATEQHEAIYIADEENSRDPTFEEDGRYVFTAKLSVHNVTLVDTVGKTYIIPKIPDGNPGWNSVLVGNFDGGSWDDGSLSMTWNPYEQVYEIRQTFIAGQSWKIKAVAIGNIYDGNDIVSLAYADGLTQLSTDLYSVLIGDDAGKIQLLYDCALYITINEDGEVNILVEEVDPSSKLKECYFSHYGDSASTNDPNYRFTKQADGTYTLSNVTINADVGFYIYIFFGGEAIDYTSLTLDAQSSENILFLTDRGNGNVMAFGRAESCTLNLTYDPESNTLTIVVVEC
ncbi:MAG: hypothetical protein J1F66_02175 [Clostridiales bacterium]|nr:hypothetical protein [Clostridiales bacterium]